ncbi:MAG TPA: patatin-like phospholipase family protein [Rhabdochlamydiaceae bacterium]|nr:patatin-like phospholipase family protein [Rhabdochlamydiaceae bacterium]
MNTLTANQDASKPKVILVLGSGGSRGLAHVGVIEELENLGIVPDAIVGCSAGAIVGALYAQHRDIAKVKEILINLKQEDLVDWSLFQKFAISKRDKFEKFLSDNLTTNDFSALEIPFATVVTDLNKGEPVYLQEGELHPAVLASAALPALFPPYQMGEQVYVDGGVCDPLPVQFARTWKEGIVIASDISPLLDSCEFENLAEVVLKSFEVAYQRLAYFSQQEADILLKMNFTNIDPLDDSHNIKFYEKGKEVTREHSKEIKEKILSASPHLQNSD